MTLTESLLPYSIEGFLGDAEIERIVLLMDEYKAAHPDALQAGSAGTSVHVADKGTLREMIDLYEPNGRIEINAQHLPGAVIEIVEDAFFRHIEDIRRAYPSAAWPYEFAYLEYGPNQFFTPHADGLSDVQCAGFGVTLTDEFTGGEFCVETCGSHRLWLTDADHQPSLAPGANLQSDWFRRIPRTRWTMTPRKGVAVFYGSALVHASQPVVSGTLKKIIAFISRG